MIEAIYALNTGFIRVPARLNEADAGFDLVDLPFLAFALRHDRGWVLVDAGARRGLLLFFGRVTGLSRTRESWSVLRRLETLGAGLGDVVAVVQTHLDLDHTAALPELASRPVFVSRGCLEHASRPLWHERVSGRFVRKEIAAPRDLRTFDFAPKRDLDLGPFTEGHDILDDGSVVAVSLPGHAGGHAGVLCRMSSGRRVLLCGDAVMSEAHLLGSPFGLFPRSIAYEKAASRATLEGLRELRRTDDDLRIVPSHEPDVGRLSMAGPVAVGGM